VEFCRSLSRRGLSAVQLVISDAHEGLRGALSQVFAGATWQRCKVHFLRNVASAVPKLHAPAVLAVVKSIFLQPARETARDAVGHALSVLEPRFPSVAAKLRAAEADVLAYLDFPVDHWRSISSTNAIERVNAELDRRAKVVGSFRTPPPCCARSPRCSRTSTTRGRTDAGISVSSRWRGCSTPTVHHCSPIRSRTDFSRSSAML
jgi:putative transposase